MPWIFGPVFPGHPRKVEFWELRGFDVPTRALAFRARVDAFFLKQTNLLSTRKVWAPFPLAVMTCIGMEMVSSYKYGDAVGDNNDHFKNFAEDMHKRFGKVHTTPEGKQEKLAYFLYKGFRNSLAHGFYGRWVFITHEDKKAKTFRYSPNKRLVVLNVYWFYRRFRTTAKSYLDSLVKATDPNRDPLLTFNQTFERNFALWL